VKTISRRDLCLALPASVSMAGLRTSQAPAESRAETAAEGPLSISKVFSPDNMQAITRANGAKSWNILHGFLATGEKTGLHESLQPPGIAGSETFSYDQLPVSDLPNGGTMRRVFSGVLVTGEYVEVHESVLPPGKMPHPPHRHRNSEILFIREGKLEFLNDGKPEPVGPRRRCVYCVQCSAWA
jgi:hypothetical protein